jgi:light-harvesting protein B-800-850 alpha chain
MNNAKMWLVVKPTVGVPLFLSAVAVGSFSVHVAVLSNTSWVADFLSGKELGTGDQTASATILENPDAAKASFTMDRMDGAKEVTIILSDGTPVKAILQPSEVHAAASGDKTYSIVSQ